MAIPETLQTAQTEYKSKFQNEHQCELKGSKAELFASQLFPRLIPQLIRAADLEADSVSDSSTFMESSDFNLNILCGRLVELSASRPSACLSLGCTLLLQARKHFSPAIWITVTRDTFFPPDLAANGVDLSLLPVVWVPDVRSAGQAADWLLRTGAFGLLIIDLYRSSRLPMPLQARLAQLAHRHSCVVCFLTIKPEESPSLGSLISLYARIRRSKSDAGDCTDAGKGDGVGCGAGDGRGRGAGHFSLSLQVIKDKKRAPVWRHVEQVDGPPGLC